MQTTRCDFLSTHSKNNSNPSDLAHSMLTFGGLVAIQQRQSWYSSMGACGGTLKGALRRVCLWCIVVSWFCWFFFVEWFAVKTEFLDRSIATPPSPP